MALITAAEARENIPSLSGTDTDTLLTTLITVVGRLFARFCGYPGKTPTMESASYTEILTARGRDLRLSFGPLIAITSLYDDPTLDYTASTYLIASSNWQVLDVDRGWLRLLSTASYAQWSGVQDAIKVTYTAGYATVPDDLKQLARLAVRHLYDNRQVQGRQASSVAGASEQLQPEALLPQIVLDGLAFYSVRGAVG